MQQVLERANYLAIEYCHFDAATMPLHVPESWNFHVTSTIIQKILFISCKPPPPRFVKRNFDGSIKDAMGGARYIIWGLDGNLLAARSSRLFEPSILKVELRAA